MPPGKITGQGLGPPPEQDIVLIGGTGDLAKRKLLPAIYNLYCSDLLPDEGAIIGYARTPMSDADYRRFAADSIRQYSRNPFDYRTFEAFAHRLEFVAGRDGGIPELSRRRTRPDRIVYVATPPSAVPGLAEEFGHNDLVEGTRLIVEKPWGHDLESSRALDQQLHRYFDEEQIFRIDHYLGKETVQNILVFRMANAIWERLWNRDVIDHIQITVAESVGVEGRGSFYDEVGALRDIIQNHVLQVLAVLTMEPPASFDPEAIHAEKVKLLQAVEPFDPRRVVRGQYTAGEIDGQAVPGYRDDEGTDARSNTETFVAVETRINNWRWAGVPFYLRSGKRLPRRVTEVHIQFRDAPLALFRGTEVDRLYPNHLTLRIQPEPGIALSFLTKEPGAMMLVDPVRMQFSWGGEYEAEVPEAYERLLYDAMIGDSTLFTRADSVHRSWAIVQPVLDAMPPLHFYEAGTWGPAAADRLVTDGRGWHLH